MLSKKSRQSRKKLGGAKFLREFFDSKISIWRLLCKRIRDVDVMLGHIQVHVDLIALGHIQVQVDLIDNIFILFIHCVAVDLRPYHTWQSFIHPNQV